MIKFIKTADPENRFDNTNVSVEVIDEVNLDSLFRAFEDFLRGCGYQVENESIEMVEKDD